MDQRTEQEFREYVTARHAAFFRVAVLLTGHREDAEDLLQAALSKLALNWHRVAKAASMDSYVRKILYHQQVSWWRHSRHRHEHITSHPPETGTPGDLANDSAQRITLAAALAQLTKRQRAVVVLRYYEDLPEAEVAAILRCSVGTVRSQTARSLDRLRVHYPQDTFIKEAA